MSSINLQLTLQTGPALYKSNRSPVVSPAEVLGALPLPHLRRPQMPSARRPAHGGPRGEQAVSPHAPLDLDHTMHSIPYQPYQPGPSARCESGAWKQGKDTMAGTKQDATPPPCDFSIPSSLPFQVLLASFHSLHLHSACAPSACPLTSPSFSFSAPLPLCGLPLFSLSLTCGPPLLTVSAQPLSLLLSASPPPTCSPPQGLSSTGP